MQLKICSLMSEELKSTTYYINVRLKGVGVWCLLTLTHMGRLYLLSKPFLNYFGSFLLCLKPKFS